MTEVRIADDGGDTVLGIDFGGSITGNFWKRASERKAMFDHLPNFKCKGNDIMLCTFPKAGTNWLYEIIMMVMNRSAERIKCRKLDTMIDAQTQEYIDMQPSPRVLNSHFPPRLLPQDMKKRQIQTILCNRNPKDTAVSYFHHVKGFKMYEYTGKWENWIRPYVQGKFEGGKYSEYLNEWQTAIDEGPGYPLHTLYYEDLKQNGYEEVSKIAKFLDVELDDQTTQDIVNMCEFDKMRQDKKAYTDPSDFEKIFNKGFNFFRKGTIGDWRNHFTVAQNEMFEEEWNMSLRKDTIFKFKYT